MAAKRKKKKKKGHYAEPEDILAGRTAITPLELVRLIHRINPTDRKLSADKTSEQYRLKASLQSLLIKKYSDSLVIEQPDPGQPRLIGIKLKHFSEDACHTLLHELESEARSWVQEQIDKGLASSTGNASKKPTNDETAKPAGDLPGTVTAPAEHDRDAGRQRKDRNPNELLNLGHKALEKYDYEKAEEYYSRAFRAAPDNQETVIVLFEFLLDHLAAYEKVLEYSQFLSSLISKEERIKILRARALAYCGKINEALDCLDRTSRPEAGKVYLLAARHFLENGDLEHAARLQSFLESLKDVDLLLETERLKNDIHQLRIKNLLPIEQEMIAAQRQGKEEKAARLAEKLLFEWPENKIARRIRHDFTEQQKIAEKSRLLERADQVRSKGEFSREIEILKKALSIDKNDHLITQRLARTEKDASLKREEGKIKRILNLLEEGKEKEACTDYADLNHKLRQRLLTETGHRRFNQIERIITEQPTLKPEKIVDAALALAECRELLARGNDPQTIIRKLRKHEKILQSLPEFLELLQQVKKMAGEIKTARTANLLRQVDRALSQKEPRTARSIIDRIKTEDLDDQDRQLYAELTDKLKHHEKIHRLSQKYEAEDQAENHLAARVLARQLAVIIPAEARLWRKKAALHNEILEAEWSVVECDPKNLPPGYHLAKPNIFNINHHNCLMPDERHLILVTGFGRWLLVSVFDLDRQTFNKTIILQPPKEITFPETTLTDRTVWISSGMTPVALALSLEPFEILSWYDFSDLFNDNDIIENILLFPKTEHMWIGVRSRKKGGDDLYNIVRLDQHRIERRIKLPTIPLTVNRKGCMQVVVPPSDRAAISQPIQIYSTRGRIEGSFPIVSGKIVDTITIHPNSNDYILLSFFDSLDAPIMEEIDDPDFTAEEDEKIDDNDIEGNYSLTMEVLPETEKGSPAVRFADSHGELVHGIYSLPEKRLVFVYYCCYHNRNYRLVAFRFSGNHHAQLYEVDAPPDLNLVTNETNRKIIAINYLKNEIQAVELNETEPTFIIENTDTVTFGRDLPIINDIMTCGKPASPIKAKSMATATLLRNSSIIKIIAMIETTKMEAKEDTEEIITLIEALKMTAYFSLANELQAWFKNKHPDHPRNLMDRADEAIKENRWQEAVSLLEGIAITDLDDGTASHICHLLGLAQFTLGEVDTARETWERGEARERGDCELKPLIAYAEFASMSTEERLIFRSDNELFASLDIYERVDACLRDRDWLTTITTMESYNITSLTDLQILARISKAYLHYPAKAGEGRWLAKVMVLATFLNCFEDEIITSRYPLLPPYIETWPHTRIQEIAAQVTQWLEQIAT